MKKAVEATSIAEHARRGERVDISGASITGMLDLSHGVFAQPILYASAISRGHSAEN